MSPSGALFCLSPGEKHFSHTAGGGTNNLFVPRGTNISLIQLKGEGDKHFSIIMMMIENVSEANILSSEARKPPAGARISGPVGP